VPSVTKKVGKSFVHTAAALMLALVVQSLLGTLALKLKFVKTLTTKLNLSPLSTAD